VSPLFLGRTLNGMGDMRDNAALLDEYARTGSREIVGELARRHAAMVYSAARRQVGDGHLAEDVTQAVFILLFSKASSIHNPAQLVGWLYKTTRYTALNAMKIENRRKRHEEKAAAQKARQIENAADPLHWEELSPILDQAMAELPEADRQSILLRYFQGLSVREVAGAMTVSEEATKKRLSRGLDRLRRLLGKKGVVVGVGVLGVTLAARATEAAPEALGSSIRALVAGQSGTASKFATALAEKVARSMFLRTAWIVGTAASVLIGVAGWQLLAMQDSPAGNARAATTAPSATTLSANTPPDNNAASPDVPFLTLPGDITGSPMPVDLDGSGKPEIVVAYMGMVNTDSGEDIPMATGAKTDPAAYVGAFHLDGTPVAGWPVKIMTAELHKAVSGDTYPNWWISTPTVQGASAGTPGFVVVSKPYAAGKGNRGTVVIQANGTLRKLGTGWANADPGTTLTLADLSGNGNLDILGGGTSCTIGGTTIPGWRGARAPNGFSASAGDVAGDGHVRMFMVSQRHGVSNAVIDAFDPTGKSFGSWPQKIGIKSFSPPSLGDVFGDGKMEVIVPDFRGHILAWTWDGKPFGACVPEANGQGADGSALSPEKAELEKCTSIFKDGIHCVGPVSLADLDGDGLAEIIVVDGNTATLRAWHGDGTGFGNPDGIIAHLGSANAVGVSVAGPDAAGGFDFFAGAWWAHRDKDGTVRTRLMVPTVPGTALSDATVGADGPAPEAVDMECQDTIADLYGDGLAEVLIGTSDGRVYIFHTGLKYTPQWAQWPMFGRDVHHTSCWTPAKR
jgi:RNA polymerase sigma factor (sigma-70 family)